jgi:hypothetical protein
MSIVDQVLHFIAEPNARAFDSLALAVFRYQYESVPAYGEYCRRREATPDTVAMLTQIPPVSTLAFKYAAIENRNEGPSAPRLFLTSGTTMSKDERGRHLVRWPEVYRASAIAHLRRMMFPDGRRLAMLALHPTADQMEESSLSQMISWCIEEFGHDANCCAASRAGLDLPRAISFLRDGVCAARPVCILATTAALAATFAAMRTSVTAFELPPGSRVMDTGGAKGQTLPLSADEVVAEAGRLMGVAPAMVINEYGMTEMCSQLYDATPFNSAHSADTAWAPQSVSAVRSDAPPAMRIKLAPPWLRVFALDPLTLAPLPEGVGLLSFFDLANVGSVSALMTEDFGIVRDAAVLVLGRAAASDPRGCALAIEQFSSLTAPPPN